MRKDFRAKEELDQRIQKAKDRHRQEYMKYTALVKETDEILHELKLYQNLSIKGKLKFYQEIYGTKSEFIRLLGQMVSEALEIEEPQSYNVTREGEYAMYFPYTDQVQPAGEE